MSKKNSLSIKQKRFIMSLGVALVLAGIRPFTGRSDFGGCLDATNTVSLGALAEHSDKVKWIMRSSMMSGNEDNSNPFHSRLLQEAKMFDRDFTTRDPESQMFSTLLRLCFMVFIGFAVFLYLLFLDVKLTIFSLLPAFSSLVCTLGIVKLAGQSLNVSSLMLALGLPGMSVYGSLLVGRSYQRPSPRSLRRRRLAIVTGSTAAIIGFGSLFAADPNLLKGTGSLIPVEIGVAMAGTFVMLASLLDWYHEQAYKRTCSSKDLRDRVLWRYRSMEAYPRFFARFKTWLDPMFSELPGLLEGMRPVRTIIDIGTGYGVPAAWFLETFPGATVFGLDPDENRIRVAALATRDRGEMVVGRAPEIPSPPEPAELATLLDVIQYVGDDALEMTLNRLADALCPGGIVMLRISVPLNEGNPWTWWIEYFRVKAKRIAVHYRSVSRTEGMLRNVGFTTQYIGPSGKNGDLFWLVGTLKTDHPLP